MGQQIMLMAITYFVAEIVILCHLKCPPDVTPRGKRVTFHEVSSIVIEVVKRKQAARLAVTRAQDGIF